MLSCTNANRDQWVSLLKGTITFCRSVHPRSHLRDCTQKQWPDRDVNAHEYNCKTCGHDETIKRRGSYTFLLDSRKIQPLTYFSPPSSLGLLYIIFLLYSSWVACPTRYTLVARCGFVRCNTCSSSTFVYTSHKVFFLIVTVLPLFPRAPFFFLPSLSSKYISDMHCLSRKILCGSQSNISNVNLIFFAYIFAIKDVEGAVGREINSN